uniref:Geminin coiled-coil domain containing n=1 Tax=Scleropages formosus TaxID=113540 RepID=A0A8C9RQH6_SCLFO
MCTVVSCQEVSFAGGQHYNWPGPCPVPTSAHTVDVAKETVVSFWAAAPPDNAVCQREPLQHEIIHPLDYVNNPDPVWTDHLSPQLLRNKQLQDTLLQREEELARLHEENSKLKKFLNSSFVKCLEEKAKILLSGQQNNGKIRKRISQDVEGPCASQLLSNGHGKRVCRNVSLEFCSTEELAAASPIDSWILQTLGLKDQNTPDPPKQQNDSADCSTHYSTHISPVDHYALRTNTNPSAYYSCPYDYSTAFNVYTNLPLHSSVTSTEMLRSPFLGSDTLQTHFSSSGANTGQYSSPCTPQGRTDLAFRMSLSPSSSVRTHSFPQGQAFVRRDTLGGWNFTWIPKHAP